MKRVLLIVLFSGLLAVSMFGWGLGIAPGVSLKNLLLYLPVLIIGIEAAIKGRTTRIEVPALHLRSLWPQVVAVAIMYIAAYAASAFLHEAGVSEVLILICAIIAGVLTYTVALRARGRDLLTEMILLVRCGA